MRVLFLSLLSAFNVQAADYRLEAGADVRDGSLQVTPTVQGPAGAQLRYEIETVREGANGTSSSSQAGGVRLGEDGRAKLATTSVNVVPSDRYRVKVRVLEGGRVVAEEEVRHPR